MKTFDYRTIWWSPICSITESSPHIRTLKMGHSHVRVMLPYVQYIRYLDRMLVTFSNEPSSLEKDVYLNPLPNMNYGYVCMGYQRRWFGKENKINYFTRMNKSIDLYWTTRFDCPHLSHCGIRLNDWVQHSKTKNEQEILSVKWSVYKNKLKHFSSLYYYLSDCKNYR